MEDWDEKIVDHFTNLELEKSEIQQFDELHSSITSIKNEPQTSESGLDDIEIATPTPTAENFNKEAQQRIYATPKLACPVLERKNASIRTPRTTNVRRQIARSPSSSLMNTFTCLTIKDGTGVDGFENLSTDTRLLRNVVFDNWNHNKVCTAKVKREEAAILKKTEAELKAKERETKIKGGLAAFDCWNLTKTTYLEQKIKELKRIREEKRENKETSAQEKMKGATVAYKYWKEQKERLWKETIKTRWQDKHMKWQVEEKKKWERRQKSLIFNQKWNEQKDDMERRKLENALDEQRLLEETNAEKLARNYEALDAYQEWLQDKEIQYERKRVAAIKGQLRPGSPMPRPPWSPPGLS